MKRFLFICGKNKLRSPTAEHVFSLYPTLDVRSAGLNNDSECLISTEDILWAEYIFVMEKSHKQKLQTKFRKYLKDQKVIVLNIPDKYDFMEPSLITELKKKVEKYI